MKLEPELIPELYRRASFWYENQGWYEEACDAALQASDLPRAATLLADLVPELIVQEQDIQMRRWLSQLSPEVIIASSQFWFASLWTQWGGEGAAQLIKQLEQQGRGKIQNTDLSRTNAPVELSLFQAWAALYQGDRLWKIALVQEALHAQPKPEGRLRHLIAVHQSIVLSRPLRDLYVAIVEASSKVCQNHH